MNLHVLACPRAKAAFLAMPSSAPSEIDQLRTALAALETRGGYPPAVGSQVVHLVQQHQRQDGSACGLAADLGLAPTTVLGWLCDAPAPSPFLPVLVREPPAPRSTHELLLPGGARVEGLSLEDVGTLCRKVGS